MVLEKKKDWFASWFDTPYYHTLYQHRDDTEAQLFIDNLISFLAPKTNATVLDLACGKGRHALHLAQNNFQVTGVDLSEKNIAFAKQFEQKNLRFYEHDMRLVFRPNHFDFIFNLFTSFGFFDQDEVHLEIFKNIAKGLKPDGIFIFDFLNFFKVESTLIPIETKVIDGITFHIKRFIKDGFIHKQIDFEADGRDWSFEEKVRGFKIEEIEIMLKKAGLKVLHTFGNYNLETYDKSSKRLIIISNLETSK